MPLLPRVKWFVRSRLMRACEQSNVTMLSNSTGGFREAPEEHAHVVVWGAGSLVLMWVGAHDREPHLCMRHF